MSVQFTDLQNRLLAAPDPWFCRQWYEDRDFYRTTCQITEADLPELRHLVEQWNDWYCPDELEDNDELANRYEMLPIVAARAVSEWPSEENFQTLLALVFEFEEGDDWLLEELPKVWGRIGEVAIAPLARLAADKTVDEIPRLAALEGIAQAYKLQSSLRDSVVATFVELLEEAAVNPTHMNAVLAWDLAEIGAIEAAELIERTFAANLIDIGFAGPWETHRQLLGVPGLGLPMPERPVNSCQFNMSAEGSLEGYDDPLSGEDDPEFSDDDSYFTPAPRGHGRNRISRNDPCPCGSGKKFKKCCLT